MPGASGGSERALAELGARWADLRLRVITASILAPVTLLCVWAGGYLYALLLLVGWGGVAWEWCAICRMRPIPVAAGLLYAVLALGSLFLLRSWGGPRFTFSLLAVVWCSDIGAYAAGRIFGGPRLAPRISPGKTWSGAAGGLVAAMVGGSLVAGFASVTSLAVMAVLGIASQLGDLGESALKRHYNVKDSGKLLPGHGGLLDRLDGLMAAGIVAGIVLLAALDHMQAS